MLSVVLHSLLENMCTQGSGNIFSETKLVLIYWVI